MTNDSPLPSAAPITPARTAAPRRRLRIAAIAALVAGVVATGAVVAIAQPGRAPEISAHATLANAEELPVEVAVGSDAIGQAEDAIAAADKASRAAASGVSTKKLDRTASALAEYEELSREDVVGLAASATEQAEAVEDKTAEAKKKAAAEKKAAEEEAKAEEAAIEEARTPSGAQEAARTIAADEFGWGSDEFSCVYNLWQKESGWNYEATNAGSGAYGIVQSLPGSKMASVGADWQTNPLTQIRWGLGYIRDAYGTPCSAWGHSQAMNWY